MKPICMKCKLFYKPKKNGVAFIEGMPTGSGFPRPGWKPYKLWEGDLWECKGCGHEIIVGVGAEPIAIQHQPTFQADLQRFAPEYQINDC